MEWQATAGDGRETAVSLPGRPGDLAGAATVEYRTTLSDPRDPGEEIAVLLLRGLYARATVAVEGRLDGDGPVEHDIYFLPVRVPFVPDGRTELRVTCREPDDRFGGVHDTDEIPDEQSVPGVWWGADIETGSFPYLEHVTAHPERAEDGWVLHVQTSVLTGGADSCRLTYSVRPEGGSRGGGTMERERVETTGPGRTCVERTVRLRDPARWWPRGLGDQNRHVLRVRLGDQERTVTFGLREVAFDEGTVLVNGRAVPVRGVNLLDVTPGDIERALDINATLVRAHAHALPAGCYEACDEAGLLVWQDLPLTGPGGFDHERGRDLARALARHTAHHPSVAVYAAHDDPIRVASGLGDGLLDRLRLRWRAWRVDHDGESASALAAALPDPAIPTVGGPGLGCEAAAYYPGWRYGTPGDIETLLERYSAEVVAEYGAPASGEDSKMDTPVSEVGSARSAESPAAKRHAQAGVVGTIAESLRCESVGGAAFCLRDAGDGGFGVYDHGGEPKPARDVLARAYRPVQAFLTDPSPGDSPVVVVNDSPEQVRGTLRWSAGEREGRLDVAVGAWDRWSGGPVSVPPTATTVELELVGESTRAENVYRLTGV